MPDRHVGPIATLALAAAFQILAVVTPASAQAPAVPADFLKDMPAAEALIAPFADPSDPPQSLGRQCAALDFIERGLFRNVAVMTAAVAGNPATQSVRADISSTFTALRTRYAAAAGGMDDARQKAWSAMCGNGGAGALNRPVTREEAFAVLPPPVLAAYRAATAISDQQVGDIKAREAAATQRAAELRAAEAARDAADLQRRLIGLAAGLLLIAAGLFLVLKGGRLLFRLDKTEFENRTSGGTVEFANYEAAVRHNNRRVLAERILQPSGIVIALIGAIVAFATW